MKRHATPARPSTCEMAMANAEQAIAYNESKNAGSTQLSIITPINLESLCISISYERASVVICVRTGLL